MMIDYHEELKQEYIDTFTGGVRSVTKGRLERLSQYERRIGKDILNWSEEDFGDFLTSLENTNFNSLSSQRSAITKYCKYLCDRLGIDDGIARMTETFVGDKLHKHVVIEAHNSTLITCYDYENIINNKVPGGRMYPLEQVIFIFFWHNILERPNDIFEFPMDRIDLNGKRILKFDDTWVELSDKEIEIIKKLKKDQTTRTEVIRKKQGPAYAGTIEIDENCETQADALYTKLRSDNLIHPIVGVSFKRDGQVAGNTYKDTPIQVRFGKHKILEITKIMGEKVEIDFKPISIIRSGVYYRKSKEYNITLENVKDARFYLIFGDVKGRASYQKEEFVYILERMAKQELKAEYEKNKG